MALGTAPTAESTGAEAERQRGVKKLSLRRMIIGFLRVPGCPRGGGVPGGTPKDSGGEDWGTLGKIRAPPLLGPHKSD